MGNIESICCLGDAMNGTLDELFCNLKERDLIAYSNPILARDDGKIFDANEIYLIQSEIENPNLKSLLPTYIVAGGKIYKYNKYSSTFFGRLLDITASLSPAEAEKCRSIGLSGTNDLDRIRREIEWYRGM